MSDYIYIIKVNNQRWNGDKRMEKWYDRTLAKLRILDLIESGYTITGSVKTCGLVLRATRN